MPRSLPASRVVAAALLALPMLAHADCKDRFNEWTHALHPGRTVDAALATCKAWPANPAQTLAVLPLPQKGNTDDEGVYDVDVLVADSQSGKILAHRFETAALTSDAVALQSLALDTAQYRLTPQQLAFGMRAVFNGSSRVNPYTQTTLSLFVVDGATLRKVVNNLNIEQGTGEWDGNCDGQFSETSRTVAIGPAGANGYAKLIVNEKVDASTNKRRGDDCKTTNSPSRRKAVTLEYDGRQYGLPKGLSDDQ